MILIGMGTTGEVPSFKRSTNLANLACSPLDCPHCAKVHRHFPSSCLFPFEVKWSESHSVVSDSLWPHGLYSPWNSPGQNTGMGSLSFLHGTFPTEGWNPGLLHCRQILYQLKGILQKGSALNLINCQRPHLLVSSVEVRISKYMWGSQIFSLQNCRSR